MKQINNKTLIVIIGVLLVSNLVLLGIGLRVFPRKKGPREMRSPTEFMTRELQLNKDQAAKFTAMWEENKQTNKPLYDSLKLYRADLYNRLKTGSQPDSLAIRLADRIGEFEKQVVLNNNIHFGKVRAICSPEQQIKLDTVILKMGNRRR
jgi:periplasmic protein CpxP/Spy